MTRSLDPNATFYSFKDSPSNKYYTTGRGFLTKEVFEVFTVEERKAQLLKDNDGRWPGLSSAGDHFYLIVAGDDEFDHGWPLMFKPKHGSVA